MNKIYINKQYKTRSGLPVRIYAVDVDNDTYNVHGAYYKDGLCVIEAWSNTGMVDVNQYEHVLDLIEIGKYDHINIDDKVKAWSSDAVFVNGHFAGVTKNGRPKIWGNGMTSFTVKSNNCFQVYDNCEIVNK